MNRTKAAPIARGYEWKRLGAAETVKVQRTHSSGRARAQRQPGALTAAMATHHSHTPSPGARVHSRQCLFNHLPGQLCHCRIGGADYLPRKLQQFIQASARGIHNMAPSKLTVVVALVASLLLLLCNSNTKAAPPPAPALGPPPHQIVDPAKDCGGACDLRCGAHSRKNVCSRACLKCCSVCRCVPAGTAGNRETCGKCYTDWTTHGNKTKCP